MKPARGRQSLRQTMTDNQKAMDGLARMMGKPTVSLGAIPDAPKPRAKPAIPPMLEKDIQKAIIHLLAWHPKVHRVIRMNSGTFMETDAHGDARYIRASTLHGVKGERISDLLCQLKDGRLFAIEVKRPGWKKPTDQREIEQAAYIAGVIAGKGEGMFATSSQEVADKLDGIILRLET